MIFFSFQAYTMNIFTDRACVYYRAWWESERTCTSWNRVKSSSHTLHVRTKKRAPPPSKKIYHTKKQINKNKSRIRLKMTECDEAMNTPHKSLPCI